MSPPASVSVLDGGKAAGLPDSCGKVCKGEAWECVALQKLKVSGKFNQMQNVIKFPHWKKVWRALLYPVMVVLVACYLKPAQRWPENCYVPCYRQSKHLG